MSATGKNGRTANLKPFPPGRSGNPSGRPRSSHEFAKLCRETSDEAFERLRVLAGGRGLTAYRALELWLAYGHGRPQQNLAVTATRLSAMPEAFTGAAAALLERALDQADGDGTTDDETVAAAAKPSSLPPVTDADVDIVSKAWPSEAEKGSAP